MLSEKLHQHHILFFYEACARVVKCLNPVLRQHQAETVTDGRATKGGMRMTEPQTDSRRTVTSWWRTSRGAPDTTEQQAQST